MKNIDLGAIKVPLDEYASQGNAILGIRDSGKSYTATAIAERLMDSGIPIIAFDPIGIWRYLRVPGSGKGYEVVVAGGKQGDLPLTARGAQEIVRAAMRENVSLVVDLYDIHLSKADWRTVVGTSIRTLLYENGEHGLRHIFIEEAAEFCPQNIGDQQGQVYAEVEKLARMGGNALLGYTLINQRAEQVNKAVLELCDCLILHRQKGRNSINALTKWLDIAAANRGNDIARSLPGLAQGECWVWPAGSDTPVRTKVPAKHSFHPDRRARQAPTKSEQRQVDVSSFVGTMRTTLDAIVKEAEANDPKLLRAEIARLRAKVHGATQGATQEAVNIAYEHGRKDGLQAGLKESTRKLSDVGDYLTRIADFVGRAKQVVDWIPSAPVALTSHAMSRPKPWPTAPTTPAPQAEERPAVHINGRSTPQQRVLDALAWWASIGVDRPDKGQIGFIAGYRVGKNVGGTFGNILGKLRSDGLIEYPTTGTASLTDAGRKVARAPSSRPTTDALQMAIFERLDGPESRVLKTLIDAYPDAITKQECGARSDYTVGDNVGGTFGNILGRLRSLGLIDYPAPGQVLALPVLFPDR